MEILQTLIYQMAKDEVRNFKIFSQRTNNSPDRKDLLLFNYIRSNVDNYDEEKIFQKLYNGRDKNSFYRLKHRLTEDINKNTLLHNLDNDFNTLIHLLALAKTYLFKRNYSLVLYFLNKAEKKAIKGEFYELLDIVYTQYVNLSENVASINPEDYIIKRKENKEKIDTLRSIDDILAVIKHKILITQNFSNADTTISDLLEKTIKDFSQHVSLKKSVQFKSKIFQSVSGILLERRDYISLEEFLLKSYSDFCSNNLFNKNNHHVKLQMLTYLVNSLFKNTKYKQSLAYAEILKKAITEYNNLLFDKYNFYYYNALVMNYSIVDKPKAINILLELLKQNKGKDKSHDELYIFANLSILHFDSEKFEKALTYIIQLTQTGTYANLSMSFKLKLAITDAIIRFELKDFHYLDNRIQQIRVDYKELLTKDSYARDKEFLSLMKKINGTADPKNDQLLLKRVHKFVASNNLSIEESEIINYKNWLTQKFIQ